MVIDYGKIIFGGVDSSEYGIYISGEGVYNAPERVVEFVEVPGRNGAIAMDQGRYENISVTYPAMYLGKDQEEFREKLSDFRNAILSQKGYQRLEDSYHPDEYRMGVYASGLEVTKVFRKMRGGEFELTFNCKPQRWLSVGALPIPVDSGDVLQNPTVFDSSPLLEVEGYGNISFNGYDINLRNAVVGNIQLLSRKYKRARRGVSDDAFSNFTETYYFDRSLLASGDIITVNPVNFEYSYYFTAGTIMAETYSILTGNTITPSVTVPPYSASSLGVNINASVITPVFTFGALDEEDAPIDKTAQIQLTATTGGGSTLRVLIEFHIVCGYDYITVSMDGTIQTTNVVVDLFEYQTSTVTATSTLNLLGHPTYIDCDIGEAYRILGNKTQSLNAYVDLGSDLPTLAPDSNTITFDNTITDLKIAPRWWRV